MTPPGERHGHFPSCTFSVDGRSVWVYRPDAMAGRGEPDTWVVLGLGDRVLVDLAPGGGQFMTVDHEYQSDVTFHAYPDGEASLRLSVEAFGYGTDDAAVGWDGGYLDAATAIVTIQGRTDDEEWHDHYRVDLRTGQVGARFDGNSAAPDDLELLGDGSWLTTDADGRRVRRLSWIPVSRRPVVAWLRRPRSRRPRRGASRPWPCPPCDGFRCRAARRRRPGRAGRAAA
jgi:hypothetical protein